MSRASSGVELNVVVEPQKGMIASMATAITAANASIEKIGVEERSVKLTHAQVLICVQDRIHLASIIKRLRTIRGVHSISRLREN